MSPQTLHIGLLLFPGYQWLDAAGAVDYLNNHSQTMMKALKVPEAILKVTPIIEWHYISSDLTPIKASSGPFKSLHAPMQIALSSITSGFQAQTHSHHFLRAAPNSYKSEFQNSKRC